jgi:hypothetical protein
LRGKSSLLWVALVLGSKALAAQPCAPLDTASFPPCIEVGFDGNGISGRPPLSYLWTTDTGFSVTTSGPHLTLQTSIFPPGLHSVGLTVRNSYGEALAPRSFFQIEALAFFAEPYWENRGNGWVQFWSNTLGATEWSWSFGGVASSGGFQGCPWRNPLVHFAPGRSYSVSLSARNCRDAPITRSFTVNVTSDPLPKILDFSAKNCALGFCLFPPNVPVLFREFYTDFPTRFRYDWDGGGTWDETTTAPKMYHVFTSQGFVSPRFEITQGPYVSVAQHPSIFISRDSTIAPPLPPTAPRLEITGSVVLTPEVTPGEPVPPPVSRPLYRVAWTDSSNNELGFLLYRAVGSASFEPVDVAPANAVFSDSFFLLPATTYRFYLTAYNLAGEGIASSMVILTTPP